MTRRARALLSLPLAMCLCGPVPPATAQDCAPGTWFRAELQPTARARPITTFDPIRNRVLLFGSEPPTGSSFPEMWEWDGAVPGSGGWLRRPMSPAPPFGANNFGVMAFDAARDRIVYLDGPYQQTWEWEPVTATWTLRTSLSPIYRVYHSMAYAPDRARILLYGGAATSNAWRDDLWEWDGAAWTQLVAHSPLGDQPNVLMTYDARRRRAVFFDPLNLKVWEFDPALTAWMQRFPASMPGPRKFASLTFDPTTGHIFYFGGATGFNNAVSYNDLWEWDGDAGTWTERTLSNPPASRYAAGLIADPIRARMVLVGGLAAGDSIKFDDLWEFNLASGAQWIQRAPNSPAPRTLHGLTFDDTRREAILFGGAIISSSPSAYIPLGDTWIRPSEGPGAGAWVLQSPSQSPPARRSAVMAFIGSTRRALLFGGLAAGSQVLNDTWEWESDTRQWVQRMPATAPSPRYAAAFAFDSSRSDTILFGGAVPSGLQISLFDETWKWHSASATWVRILPPVFPPPRLGAAMAYDAARDRIILFGGFAGAFGSEALSDTWEFSPASQTWTELFPSQSPTVGGSLAMAFNPDRGTMLLRCASSSAAATWEWNGSNWTPLAPAATPFDRSSGGLIFDSARRTFLQFGGNSPVGSQLSQRTWEYTTADPPPILRHPQPLSLREGDTAAFAVSCPAPTPPTYRWRRNGIPLTDDGRITGCFTPILRIKPTFVSDAGDYDVLITGPCGTLTSNAAALSTTCYANCDLSSPALSAADYLCFLNAFSAADPYANCDNSTAPPTLNVNDFICFLNRFARGCN